MKKSERDVSVRSNYYEFLFIFFKFASLNCILGEKQATTQPSDRKVLLKIITTLLLCKNITSLNQLFVKEQNVLSGKLNFYANFPSSSHSSKVKLVFFSNFIALLFGLMRYRCSRTEVRKWKFEIQLSRQRYHNFQIITLAEV